MDASPDEPLDDRQDYTSLNVTWMARGSCLKLGSNPDGIFFLRAGQRLEQSIREMCQACPVRTDCIKWRYRHNMTAGNTAGFSPTEFKSMTIDEALGRADTERPAT